MNKLLISAMAVAVAGMANAAIYDYGVGVLSSTGTAFSTYNVAGTVGAGVRGAYLSGDWHAVSASNQWSQEAQLDVENGVGTGTYSSWGTSAGGRIGGTNTSADFTFGTVGTTWNNTTMVVPQTLGIDNFWGTGNYNGNFSIKYRQSFGSTQQSTISNSVLHLLTDFIAPMNAVLNANSPLFTRPTSLTALTTTTPGQYRYAMSSFSLNQAGIFMVGAKFDDGTRYDGYLDLYQGSFDPLSPLTNLIGLDDDGVGGFAATTGGSSAMLLQLAAGNYTMVYTQFTAGAPTSPVNMTGYVAGGSPVPEPASLAVLGLGAAALLRRRRRG